MRLLIVEDDPQLGPLLVRLARARWPDVQVELVTTCSAGEAAARRSVFDVALVDLGLPDSRGIESVLRIAAVGVQPVAMSGAPPVEGVLSKTDLHGLFDRVEAASRERIVLLENHREIREQRRWFRRQVEACSAAAQTVAVRMTPWPLVFLVTIAMLIASGQVWRFVVTDWVEVAAKPAPDE